MAKSMTKSAIIAHLATKAELSKKQVAGVLENLATLAVKEAKNGLQIPDLGKLVLRNRAAWMGRNPQTGEPIKIPAKRVVKFRVAKAMKDAVLGKKYDPGDRPRAGGAAVHPLGEPLGSRGGCV